MIDRETLYNLMNDSEPLDRKDFDELPDEFFKFVEIVEIIEKKIIDSILTSNKILIDKEEYEDLLDYKDKYMEKV